MDESTLMGVNIVLITAMLGIIFIGQGLNKLPKMQVTLESATLHGLKMVLSGLLTTVNWMLGMHFLAGIWFANAALALINLILVIILRKPRSKQKQKRG